MTTATMPTDSSPALALGALITEQGATPRRVSDFLDSLSEDDRVAATRSLGRGAQSKLWRLVDGFGELTLDHFVPKGAPVFEPVRHYGRNTLPAFVLFEKRFYRMGDGSSIGGANFNPTFIQGITGPGYFVTREDKNTREVLVDYHTVPTEKPADWPAIKRNEVGLSRFVYGFMIDRMRRVSTQVTIGRANRNGQDMSTWFTLCRKDAP
jgi:hypothetical protein